MKDKELRKLLNEKGIIKLWDDNSKLRESYHGLEAQHVRDLVKAVRDMREQLAAINAHYGITVEREEAKYVVKEAK